MDHLIVTLEKAREMLASHVELGGGYNKQAVRLILAEVQREHGMAASDRLVSELRLDQVFGIPPGEAFRSAWGNR